VSPVGIHADVCAFVASGWSRGLGRRVGLVLEGLGGGCFGGMLLSVCPKSPRASRPVKSPGPVVLRERMQMLSAHNNCTPVISVIALRFEARMKHPVPSGVILSDHIDMGAILVLHTSRILDRSLVLAKNWFSRNHSIPTSR
jgi:hypothetical protein